MPTLTITLEVPEGTTVSVGGLPRVSLTSGPARDPVEEYWTDYLRANGRSLYEAAARLQERGGSGITFEDMANEIGVPYESAKSYYRNCGRTAARWEREKSSPAPIQLIFDGTYAPKSDASGWLSRYSLVGDVVEKILEMPTLPA